MREVRPKNLSPFKYIYSEIKYQNFGNVYEIDKLRQKVL